MNCGPYREGLEALYRHYNRREYVHPDPLEFLYRYNDARDREIVGLVAACLAYGKVAQICRSVAGALAPMGESPHEFVGQASRRSLRAAYGGFRHRFTTGEEMCGLLWGVRCLVRDFGTLESAFRAGFKEEDETAHSALSPFVEKLWAASGKTTSSLLPLPSRGSACKRMHLFLRWMVRRDEVDPGVWSGVAPARLVVPLDTHMHRICRVLGLTRRNQANIRTALEITAAFRAIAPDDPVRYDFALTRLGIRDDLDGDSILAEARMPLVKEYG